MLKYILATKLEKVNSKIAINDKQKMVEIYTFSEWEANEKETGFVIPKYADSLKFCRIDEYPDYLYGTVSIPDDTEDIDGARDFFFYVTQNELIFVDDDNVVEPVLDRLAKYKIWKNPYIDALLYSFLEEIIDNDLLHLELIEQQLAELEERVMEGSIEEFNHNMIVIRKELLARSRYYSQLMSVAQELEENENDILRSESERLFKQLGARAGRLQMNTQLLRDYSMQIREVYQSQIDINQNNIMKILTVVTTIVMPLTLIVGWYGMNFKYMPDLEWVYGYPAIIVFSVAVVVCSVWWFKKKKFF